MLHIENLTVHMNSDPSAISRAFIEALLRGPELNEEEAPAPELAPITTQPPRIGDYWTGMGGIYCGVARGEEGQADHYLILAAIAPEQDFTWKAGQEFAKTVEADGHKDFALPSRFESALLYANVQDKLDTDCYHWTGTQYGEDAAWSQFFSNGHQYDYFKASARRCRFVRRSVI
jgi:hypothetical protein